jgi:predicted porin
MPKSHTRIAITTAIAMAMAVVSGNAFGLELNVYGVGHVSLDSNDDGTDSKVDVASNSSRLGFKGSQTVNDNLTVLFQYESGVDLTGQGTNDGNGPGTSDNLFSTSRDSFVGLRGRWGTALAGRQGALNQWVYDYNLFADQVGDLGNIWGGTPIPGRANSMISYTTPDLSGFDARLSYVPESDANADDEISILKLNYTWEGLKLGGAYTSIGQGANTDHNVLALTGSYDFGQWNIGGGIQSGSDIGGVSGVDRDSYTIGAAVNLGPGILKAQYTVSDSNQVDRDASQVAIGYDYAFDEATTVYIAYAATSNDANARFTANNYGHGKAVVPAPGEDPSSISVGVVYKFNVGLAK